MDKERHNQLTDTATYDGLGADGQLVRTRRLQEQRIYGGHLFLSAWNSR